MSRPSSRQIFHGAVLALAALAALTGCAKNTEPGAEDVRAVSDTERANIVNEIGRPDRTNANASTVAIVATGRVPLEMVRDRDTGKWTLFYGAACESGVPAAECSRRAADNFDHPRVAQGLTKEPGTLPVPVSSRPLLVTGKGYFCDAVTNPMTKAGLNGLPAAIRATHQTAAEELPVSSGGAQFSCRITEEPPR